MQTRPIETCAQNQEKTVSVSLLSNVEQSLPTQAKVIQTLFFFLLLCIHFLPFIRPICS
jgi:hypothetical protein